TRVSQCLRVLEPCFHHRHQLIFSWLLVLHLIYGERANLKALARHGPGHLAYHQYRRLLCAAYWCTKTLLWWFADQGVCLQIVGRWSTEYPVESQGIWSFLPEGPHGPRRHRRAVGGSVPTLYREPLAGT